MKSISREYPPIIKKLTVFSLVFWTVFSLVFCMIASSCASHPAAKAAPIFTPTPAPTATQASGTNPQGKILVQQQSSLYLVNPDGTDSQLVFSHADLFSCPNFSFLLCSSFIANSYILWHPIRFFFDTRNEYPLPPMTTFFIIPGSGIKI